MDTFKLAEYTISVARLTLRYAVKNLTAAAPLAYSSLRFSSPVQAEGDSIRRQIALRDDWLRRNPSIRLDNSLTLVDAGVSGYTGDNLRNKKHALALFLDLVERGRVPVGSYLVVENLDRLTRENPVRSIPAVLNLIAAGIKVVQLSPVEIVYDSEMEQHHLLGMLWELARGHGESKRKSVLLGQAWREKKRAAREHGTPFGRRCPAWLELDGDRYRVKDGAGAAVRKIFEWCAAGLGAHRILERLNAEEVPAFGPAGRWETGYIKKLLRNPAVLGFYQPHFGTSGQGRRPDGEPIPNYYPAVVTESLYYAAQAAMRARTGRSGRPATRAKNPFSGLLFSAEDGTKLHVCGSGYKYLASYAKALKRPEASRATFPLDRFVEGVLSRLRELKACDLFDDPGAGKVQELTGRLDEVEKRLRIALERFEADPESPTWAERVSQYDREKRSLVRELAAARAAASNPVAASWSEAVSLMTEQDPERLHAALLATVERIWVLIVPRKRNRLAVVQVRFKEGERRDYLLFYRWARSKQKSACQTWSLADESRDESRPDQPRLRSKLDLGNPEHVRRLEAWLRSRDLSLLRDVRNRSNRRA